LFRGKFLFKFLHGFGIFLHAGILHIVATRVKCIAQKIFWGGLIRGVFSGGIFPGDKTGIDEKIDMVSGWGI
jgi:hypothetical protein